LAEKNKVLESHSEFLVQLNYRSLSAVERMELEVQQANAAKLVAESIANECKISCQNRIVEIEEEVKTDRVNDRVRFNNELSILNTELEIKNQSLLVYIQG
jgi:hypothetical protein